MLMLAPSKLLSSNNNNTYLCIYNFEFPEDVVWVFIYGMKYDQVLSEIRDRGFGGWPVSVALDPPSLSLFG